MDPITWSTCTRNCGNGVLEEPAQCEDGNRMSYGGCMATCFGEDGFQCTSIHGLSHCGTVCGDGSGDAAGRMRPRQRQPGAARRSVFQRVQRTVCLGVSGPRANGFGELLPSWGRRSACALAALCALAGCESQKDQCPQPDEYWCNGNVIETCHEDTNRYTINYVYDCALIDAQCEEHDGEVDCVFAELSCAGRPAQSCEDNRKVFCPDGWSSPIPGTDCDSIRSFCVETYLGTADCSAVPESCSPETPQAKCYEGRRFVCSEGFWRRATSSEGTMCTEFMAEQ